MSNTRIKMMAAVSTDELEAMANEFLSTKDVEIKSAQYQTDGYEKPYSVMFLYHRKDIRVNKNQ